ncbi:putative acyl-CoA synthetase [Nostocoides japonicum T1-X7]|uniref:Putative acyl-CoA synthetase n=1 Tax=Nostocoides japonicum T1-X7 TaxID=1194083 RepID=A0A077LZ76_9MICO|nr:acetoacetate--CoA ligase [Tetrasphaera japonica]CCH77274.1 putative acyl-CoA synthetase [Tetrasphaera japonica T1-X7]
MPDDTTAPLWTPGHDRVAAARITAFRRHAERACGRDLPDYDALWEWSVTDLEGFWRAVWEFFGLDRRSGFDRVLGADHMPGAKWFTGSTVNAAEQLLRPGDPEATAVIGTDESGAVVRWTRQRLRDETAALAGTLTDVGVRPGDVVVGYLPNIPETVAAFLATAALGATWSCVGQDYAGDAAIDRFAQLEPTVLVTATGYHFGGRRHDRRPEIAVLQAGLASLAETIVVSRLGLDAGGRGRDWTDATTHASDLEPVGVGFDHPLWVLFSSGTTGLPKGLVHSHGGILLESLKQLGLHWDLGERDRLFWYTSPSWVMWNLLTAALALGTSIVCYDGSPTYPGPGAMWDLVADHEVTFFGTSPGYLQACEVAGVDPWSGRDLGALRSMGSTGSPLAPGTHRWATRALPDVPVWSLSGGTDVATGFVAGAPIVPVWPGELSVRCLGVALEAWDEEGHRVPDGEVGELVVTRPMPSMPVRLWNDPEGSRYRETYFSTYADAWRQGDWITVTPRGSVVIHGRSDSTLNRHGVRMGSADIYAAVDTVPGVLESLVVGAEQQDGGYWMPLFVVLDDGHHLDEELAALITRRIRERTSARHVPDEVIAVPGIPHTRTGKKLEVPVKRLLQGAALGEVANPASVDDPALLQVFADLASERLGGAG